MSVMTNKRVTGDWLNDDMLVCPICGRSFLYNTQSIYWVTNGHNHKVALCRYNCWRAAGGGYDHKMENKLRPNNKGGKKKVEVAT